MSPLKQLVTRKKELVPTSNKLTSYERRVRVLEIAGDLASTDPPNDMTGWYCECYKILGESRFMGIAKMARDPSVRKPKSVFGYLLKEEMKKRSMA